MFNFKALLGLDKYVSDIDQFLMNYRKKHPTLSESQRAEIDKHTRVFALRDHPTKPSTPPPTTLWDKF